MEAVAIDVLSDFLKIGKRDKEDLVRTVAIHDWDKKLEVKGITPDLQTQANIVRFMSAVHPKKELLTATNPEFIDIYQNGNPSLLQKIIFYIDNITNEGSIEPFRDRIDATRARHPDHDWDTELSITEEVERDLAYMVLINGHHLSQASDLPSLILSKIKDRLDNFEKLDK